MKDWHTKPPKAVRSINDAMRDASRMRRELPKTVQVLARDWDKVILADEINKLKHRLRMLQKRSKS